MTNREIRKKRIRNKIKGSADCPRLSVFRSLKYVEAQIVDDNLGKTLVYVTSKNISGKNKKDKMDVAAKVGEMIGSKAKKIKINKIKFDRGGFAYHGQVKALAEGARKAGLKF